MWRGDRGVEGRGVEGRGVEGWRGGVWRGGVEGWRGGVWRGWVEGRDVQVSVDAYMECILTLLSVHQLTLGELQLSFGNTFPPRSAIH